MGSLCEPTKKVDNGIQGSLTCTGLRIWAGRDWEKGYILLPVLPTLDDQASCCTITTGLLIDLDCNKTIYRLRDVDSCPHKTSKAYKGRIQISLRGQDQIDDTVVHFCLLQQEEHLVVLTGREKCLQYCPQVKRWAGLAADPKTNGQ